MKEFELLITSYLLLLVYFGASKYYRTTATNFYQIKFSFLYFKYLLLIFFPFFFSISFFAKAIAKVFHLNFWLEIAIFVIITFIINKIENLKKL
jgi:hypothetical protein